MGEDELFYALSDILADYRINAIFKISMFSFKKICEGMGTFWKDISQKDIKQVYNLAVATPETVLEGCEIDEWDKLVLEVC